jgi:2-(1,2-epoxy-1,2-dihydrophenyl)acetyl-CoA isomerase
VNSEGQLLSSTDLTVERRNDLLVLRMSRPQRRNALTLELVDALTEQFVLAASSGARLVTLSGEPPAFCAGGDLPQLSALASAGASQATDMIYQRFHRLVRAIHACPIPVLAAVNGPALGAGLDLALTCDLRIASDEAVFASSWITLGLVPGMGGARVLPRLIGGARAAEALLLGRRIDATEALAWGLVSEIVGANELMSRAEQIAAQMAELPETGVRLTKAALRRGLDEGLDQELATLGAVQGGLLSSHEFQQRAAQFSKPSSES